MGRAVKFKFIILVLIAAFISDSAAHARAPKRAGKMDKPSNLQPVFPENASCKAIASPFGSPTRYDGSTRPSFRFGGRHGGIDLSLPEGTPLLALAAGTVVHAGRGGQMEGFYIWLQLPPAETGLPYWIYAKYQHLQALPELAVGTKVMKGQVVAYSGKTGTTGGHYGSSGYPHLHLSIVKSQTESYQINDSLVQASDSILIDPLLIYEQTSPQPADLADLPDLQEKSVVIPYKDDDGPIRPQGALLVWPVSCQTK